jgi:hypothetical protein
VCSPTQGIQAILDSVNDSAKLDELVFTTASDGDVLESSFDEPMRSFDAAEALGEQLVGRLDDHAFSDRLIARAIVVHHHTPSTSPAQAAMIATRATKQTRFRFSIEFMAVP